MIFGHTAVTLVLSTDINYVFPGAVLNTLSPHKQATICTSSEKTIILIYSLSLTEYQKLALLKGYQFF
jgi:hypothetical protein